MESQVFLKLKEINPLDPGHHHDRFRRGGAWRSGFSKWGFSTIVSKPFELDILLHLVEEAWKKQSLSAKTPAAGKTARPVFTQKISFIRSEIMSETVNLAMRVADSEATVLISGESGTGKEVLANIIHYASARHRTVHSSRSIWPPCRPPLIEAELFGHEKGAFTGAEKSRTGRFEEANGGTIFLDEIGDLPMETQIKLLRVIQEREIVRLGSNKPDCDQHTPYLGHP